jgi:antitoxin ParD1/3/4
MPATTKRTISLPDDEALYLDSLVASGAYATDSEAVRAGLKALQERDATLEAWLRTDVVEAYDAMVRDPSRGRSIDDVRAGLRALHAERQRDASR